MRANRLPRRTLVFLSLLLVAVSAAGCLAQVRVQWTTETEMNTAGFNLYRGEAPEGPFDVKVNAQLIPPAADPLTGQAYSYIDTTAQPGVMYYYQLQEVERNGNVNTFGPIRVQAAGLRAWHVAILAVLATGVIVLWATGGKKALRPRAPEDHT